MEFKKIVQLCRIGDIDTKQVDVEISIIEKKLGDKLPEILRIFYRQTGTDQRHFYVPAGLKQIFINEAGFLEIGLYEFTGDRFSIDLQSETVMVQSESKGGWGLENSSIKDFILRSD
jgi:hypothetical protein